MTRHPLSTRTPLGKVRGLGSAKAGTTEFWHQRLTGIGLVPLTIAFVWILASLVGKDYNTVRMTVGYPLVGIIFLLFVLAGVYHMQIGMRVIIEDYVHVAGLPAPMRSCASPLCESGRSQGQGSACQPPTTGQRLPPSTASPIPSRTIPSTSSS